MIDALAGIQVKIDKRQLYALTTLAEENYLFDFVPQYATSQAKMNQNPRKVYCADWALANVVAFPAKLQLNRVLKASIYGELKRRGYQVRYRHPNTDYEIDFIAYRTFEEPDLAIQVSYHMTDEKTLNCEVRSLKNLKGVEFKNTKRMMLTMQPITVPGIDVVNIIEWLLNRP